MRAVVISHVAGDAAETHAPDLQELRMKNVLGGPEAVCFPELVRC